MVPGNNITMIQWLIFTALAAALSAYVSYYVTSRLKDRENAK